MPSGRLGEGDGVIIVGFADLAPEFFGEVGAFVGGPLVVGVGQDGPDETDGSGFLKSSAVL